MRKRSIKYIFDSAFWFVISVLPLIAFVIMLWFNGSTGITLVDVFQNCGFGIVADNFILTALIDLFGVGGVMPLVANTDILVYLSWFIIVNVIHVFVDVLLLIPRFAHALLGKGVLND